MFLLPERSKKSSKNRSNRCLNWQETSSKLESSSLQNIAFATPKHHATEGRTYASNPQSSKTLASPLAFPCLAGSCLFPVASCLLLFSVLFIFLLHLFSPLLWRAPPVVGRVGGYVCIHKVLASYYTRTSTLLPCRNWYGRGVVGQMTEPGPASNL